MKILKEIFKNLLKFEEEHLSNVQHIEKNETPDCWKLAVKLKLAKTMKEIKASSTPKGKQNLSQTKYIAETINKLENESNKMIQKSIKKCEFVKTSLNLLTNHMTNVSIHC